MIMYQSCFLKFDKYPGNVRMFALGKRYKEGIRDSLHCLGNFFVNLKLFQNNKYIFKNMMGGFPGGAVVENLPANAGDTGSSPGLGRSHVPRSN